MAEETALEGMPHSLPRRGLTSRGVVARSPISEWPTIRTERKTSCKVRVAGIPERYDREMTGLLENAIRRLERLSREDQDAIAAQIMETLDDEALWDRSFHERPDVLRVLAQEALEEHRRGETRPLEELLG